MIAELILAYILTSEIDDWKVLPNRTILAHIKGTPSYRYEMYWISLNFACATKEQEPVIIKAGHIVLITGPVGTYMRWCYVINTGESIMTIKLEDNSW